MKWLGQSYYYHYIIKCQKFYIPNKHNSSELLGQIVLSSNISNHPHGRDPTAATTVVLVSNWEKKSYLLSFSYLPLLTPRWHDEDAGVTGFVWLPKCVWIGVVSSLIGINVYTTSNLPNLGCSLYRMINFSISMDLLIGVSVKKYHNVFVRCLHFHFDESLWWIKCMK